MKVLARALPSFFVLEVVLRAFLPGRPGLASVGSAALVAAGYAAVLWLVTRVNRLHLSVFYIVLPFVLFTVGWLRWYVALPVLAVVLGCLVRTLRDEALLDSRDVTWAGVGAFSILIVWVQLSGAGGFGYQSIDYVMHNGRLEDLVSYSWPVRYEDVLYYWPMEYRGEKNLVFYLSYYLPAAVVGKLLGFSVALKAQCLWLLLGVALAFQWFARFVKVTRAVWLPGLAIVLVAFGGWDLIGLWIARAFDSSLSLRAAGDPPIILNVDTWSWWLFQSPVLRTYPSNTFQLYFAPHQVAAGWIIVSMQAYLFFEQRLRALVLVTAFYVFWSPMMLLTMTPFMVFLCLGLGRRFVELLTPENLLGTAVVVGLFGCYYLAGCALVIPGGFLWSEVDLAAMWPRLLVLYACGWGVYYALAAPSAFRAGGPRRIWFASTGLTLLVLPVYYYGEFNDLMLRGSAPFTFMLMVFLVSAARDCFARRRYAAAVLALLALLPGVGSFVFQVERSARYYGVRQPVVSVRRYAQYNYEQLGSEDSFFFKYLAKK